MSFLDRLLGRKTKTEQGNQDAHIKPSLSLKGVPSVEVELRSLCGGNSHPEYPLLRIGYSPTSRYPAADFTPWITEGLAERRFQGIAYLFTQLTLANPGLGIGSGYWSNEAIRMCNINLREAIECDDDKAIWDLHAALFPYILHGTLDGFMLLDSHVDFLARVMSPYAFSVRSLEAKVDAANQFIKKMRRETKEHSTAWNDYPTLCLKNLNLADTLKSSPPAANLRTILRGADISARQLFFGTLKDGPGQGHWIARPYGIDEEKAATELTNLGLGELRDDPSLILMTYRKEELVEALTGHPIKQGWNKKQLIKNLSGNCQVQQYVRTGKLNQS